MRVSAEKASSRNASGSSSDSSGIAARRWIAEGEPPATLDALHLASALEAGADSMATADRQLARAAAAAALDVITFAE